MSSPAPSPSEPGSPPGSLTPFLKALKSGDLETLSKLRHALRTPLNQIIGYSEMLMESAEENNAAGIVPDLKRIHSSGGQLLAIINDALAPWKIDSGRIDFPSMRLAMQGPLAAVVTQANQCLERSRASGHTELVQDLDKILTAAQNLEKLFNSSAYSEELIVGKAGEVNSLEAAIPTPIREEDFGLSAQPMPSAKLLAVIHFWVALLGAATFGIGLALTLQGVAWLIQISSVLVLLGMLIFAWTVWSNRTGLTNA